MTPPLRRCTVPVVNEPDGSSACSSHEEAVSQAPSSTTPAAAGASPSPSAAGNSSETVIASEGEPPTSPAPAAPLVPVRLSSSGSPVPLRKNRPRSRETQGGPHGIPIGRGGSPCQDCGTEHLRGVECDSAGLLDRGWTFEPTTKVWRSALYHRKRRKLSAGPKVPNKLRHVIRQTRGGTSSRTEMRDALKRLGSSVASIVERCDAQTYRLWITTAHARSMGLSDEQIARSLDVEEELVRQLVQSPPFLLFESELRRVLGSAEGVQALREKLLVAGLSAVESLEFWAQQRAVEAAGASVAASKAILASLGLTTSRQERIVKRYDISKAAVEKMIEAVVREGA